MTNDTKLHSVDLPPNDADRATGFRNEIADPLNHICDIMNRARNAGLKIEFGIAANGYGQHVATVNVVKPL